MNTIERALSKQNASKKDETAAPVPIPEPVKDTTVASPVAAKKVESTTGSIMIDLVTMEAKGFVSTNAERRQINEEYRAIKRKILNNAFGALSKSLTNSNIVMITSSRPGEGKTFTAVNLALSIALEQDKTVLLVDADVLRPNVMRTLELENQEGLMEYLLGEKQDIAEVMCNTNIPNLRIIAAGKSHHLSTELLASEKMFEAVQEFANRYTDRIVIVDTPPLLGINETAILANLAGQAIVVTEENHTKLSDIQQAVSQLNPEMAIGFVVNKGQKTGSEGSGYGYYYYGGPN
ncbi:MAG: protein-tyrosine kinase [Paraglaciecola sp.]|jgi:protein-tyrosine kinase